MIPDQVDDRRVRTTRVVQVRNAVGESRPQMQQREGGTFGHPRVTVGRAGADTLEQA